MSNTITANLNSDGRLGAHYELAEPIQAARADLPLLQRLRIRNTGRVPWPIAGAYPINLAYHWLDAQGQTVDFEGVRTVLPVQLPPGEQVEIEIHCEPPPQPGEYQLMIDMVEEGVGWFSLQGVPALIVPISVAPGPSNLPRVCIVGPLCLLNDAVGNHMLNQMRFFQKRGYQALILVEHIDFRQPRELRQYMAQMPIAELKAGQPSQYTRRSMRFFHESDIVIFHFPLHYALFDAIALVERGIVILDYHGVTPPQLWDGEGREYFIQATRRQLALLRYADYAIAHSNLTREELIRTGAVAPERVYVNSLPVALGQFRPGPRDPGLLARYKLAADQPILLYVGRMATNKRIEDLVRALALVRERLPRAALLLVGDNRSPAYAPVAERARQLAAELGVAEGLIFAGQTPDDELVAHYQLADVFVTASVHEGFCIPVLEAMACGVPVVGAHATALPETIGQAGLTFRPQDPADLAAKVLTILDGRTVSVDLPSIVT